eukprot:731147-Alexandrium_andersonii.AAC.1
MNQLSAAVSAHHAALWRLATRAVAAYGSPPPAVGGAPAPRPPSGTLRGRVATTGQLQSHVRRAAIAMP